MSKRTLGRFSCWNAAFLRNVLEELFPVEVVVEGKKKMNWIIWSWQDQIVFIQELQRDSGMKQLGVLSVPCNHVLQTALEDCEVLPVAKIWTAGEEPLRSMRMLIKSVERITKTRASRTGINTMHRRTISTILWREIVPRKSVGVFGGAKWPYLANASRVDELGFPKGVWARAFVKGS